VEERRVKRRRKEELRRRVEDLCEVSGFVDGWMDRSVGRSDAGFEWIRAREGLKEGKPDEMREGGEGEERSSWKEVIIFHPRIRSIKL